MKKRKASVADAVLISLFVVGVILSLAGFARSDAPKSPASRVAAWIYDASLEWIPLAPVTGWESRAEADTRRLSIATDIAAVAFDPAETPLFASGNDYASRANTALFLASIARYESRFDVRVDTGHCEAFPGGIKAGWCDNGNAHTLWQHNIGNGKTIDGWTKIDLIADRKKAVRAALHALQHSVKTCGKTYTGADAFSVYAQGFCGVSEKMRERLRGATTWAKDHGVPSETP
jgi:hypothetical protein